MTFEPEPGSGLSRQSIVTASADETAPKRRLGGAKRNRAWPPQAGRKNDHHLNVLYFEADGLIWRIENRRRKRVASVKVV